VVSGHEESVPELNRQARVERWQLLRQCISDVVCDYQPPVGGAHSQHVLELTAYD
jgi:hypothetical protein